MGEVVDVESGLVPDQEIQPFFGVELNAEEVVVGIVEGWVKLSKSWWPGMGATRANIKVAAHPSMSRQYFVDFIGPAWVYVV